MTRPSLNYFQASLLEAYIVIVTCFHCISIVLWVMICEMNVAGFSLPFYPALQVAFRQSPQASASLSSVIFVVIFTSHHLPLLPSSSFPSIPLIITINTLCALAMPTSVMPLVVPTSALPQGCHPSPYDSCANLYYTLIVSISIPCPSDVILDYAIVIVLTSAMSEWHHPPACPVGANLHHAFNIANLRHALVVPSSFIPYRNLSPRCLSGANLYHALMVPIFTRIQQCHPAQCPSGANFNDVLPALLAFM